MNTEKRAVVLFSGGLDSSTALAIAQNRGYVCYTLNFEYGQRHRGEIAVAKRCAERMGVREHRLMQLDLAAIGGSALTDTSIDVPEQSTEGVPVTYVPARNTVFLSLALAWAEVLEAERIFIGVNAVDYSGYPDCRPEFIEAFQAMARLATKWGTEGQAIHIETPLIHLSKAEIIRLGLSLGVDYGATASCYQLSQQGLACGKCDACRLRSAGFREAGVADPTPYQR